MGTRHFWRSHRVWAAFGDLLPNDIGMPVVKTGAGTLELVGDNNLQNGVTIAQAAIVLGDASNGWDAYYENGSIKGNVVVNSGAYLQFANGLDQTFGNNISGTGTVQLYGGNAAAVTFSGSNTYSGETQLLYGATLQAAAPRLVCRQRRLHRRVRQRPGP